MYRVKCLKCGKVFDEFARIEDRLQIKCECGGSTEIWFAGLTSVNLRTTMYGRENKPLVLEHMTEEDDDIVKVTSKQQLRDAVKEHNCISPILD